MGEVQIEDITVPWGAVPDPLDIQNGHWRMAVYQDCEEGFGGQKLYFLYDPVADENSGTTFAFIAVLDFFFTYSFIYFLEIMNSNNFLQLKITKNQPIVYPFFQRRS